MPYAIWSRSAVRAAASPAARAALAAARAALAALAASLATRAAVSGNMLALPMRLASSSSKSWPAETAMSA